ncbi:hypothetical protein JDV02_009659 [Purpureocillium takamizusanense]|uniref:Uncharacterized protein n=1 Tax=Purpureocillium takamizusanense TaxID=2060973 RepID=A0A9Q8QS55_9HYPO|nr:uncharacterized protein JDV02_009659 [Purpureocillium takamizusanense]UNI23866.1 hypothetical protein JDV02_009659 [Purpureocillium takamizusanense]
MGQKGCSGGTADEGAACVLAVALCRVPTSMCRGAAARRIILRVMCARAIREREREKERAGGRARHVCSAHGLPSHPISTSSVVGHAGSEPEPEPAPAPEPVNVKSIPSIYVPLACPSLTVY